MGPSPEAPEAVARSPLSGEPRVWPRAAPLPEPPPSGKSQGSPLRLWQESRGFRSEGGACSAPPGNLLVLSP